MKEYEYEAQAMGTAVSIAIVTDNMIDAESGQKTAFDTINSYEQRFSRFLPNSELSQLNESKTAIVSPLFYKVFTKAVQAYNLSQGIFNPLVQITRLGYTKNFRDLPSTKEITNDDQYNICLADIQTDKNTRTITLAKGQKLDFGGFLKGYLAEKIAKTLIQKYSSYQGIIVNIGGDLHTIGTDANHETFVFNIFNPVTKEDIPIPIHNKSLATSGTYQRAWQTNRGHIHHILDQAGKSNPISDIISASVIHPHGLESETYTKIFLSQPLLTALKLIDTPAISYLLITNTGKIIQNL